MESGSTDPALVEILSRMERLLRDNHEYNYANSLDDLLKLLDTAPEKALSILISNTFWGGAGSFVDIYLCETNHHISDDFDRDNRMLRKLLLQLLLHLKERGYTWSRQEFQGQYLTKWTR